MFFYFHSDQLFTSFPFICVSVHFVVFFHTFHISIHSNIFRHPAFCQRDTPHLNMTTTVLLTDSVLSAILIKGAYRFAYHKNAHDGEYKEDNITYSHSISVQQQNVKHFAISGWFMTDGIPPIVQMHLLNELRRNEKITFLLSVGINDLRLVLLFPALIIKRFFFFYKHFIQRNLCPITDANPNDLAQTENDQSTTLLS